VNIQDVIKKRLSELNSSEIESIYKKLGYRNSKKAKERIDELLNAKSLYEFLYKTGSYDFVNSSKEFLYKLCLALNINSSIYKNAIDEADKIDNEKKKFLDSYIFIDTGFKRKGEPVVILAMSEGLRRFKPPIDKLLFKDENEILDIVARTISNHYRLCKEGKIQSCKDGRLSLWGEIKRYIFHHRDKSYIFDTNGKLIDKPENRVGESKAVIVI
jgi:hypothetical protein